jgi:hypothetical protein
MKVEDEPTKRFKVKFGNDTVGEFDTAAEARGLVPSGWPAAERSRSSLRPELGCGSRERWTRRR